jgi:hypothetical protein
MDTPIQELVKKLIDLKLDLIAHINVFRNSRVSDQKGNPVDWHKAVESARWDLDNSQAADLYSKIVEQILSAKPDTAEALPALIALLDQKTPMEL